jgi:type I restriction enzyme S subunit
MSEWKEILLPDITTKIGDGLHGTPIYDNNGDYYFINGNNLVNGKIIIKEDTKRVSESEFHRHAKPLNERTLLLGINGTIGNVAYYKNEKCMLGKSACYINLNNDVDARFVYYTFLGRDFQNYIEGIATGTTIPNVPLKGIREFSFKIPPLPDQAAIASVLSSLDDKIDLLHRQNATLEKMAETLFRQWFVEEAKEDWETNTLSYFADFFNGKTRPNEVGHIPIYGGNGILGYTSKSNYSGKSIIIGRVGAYCGSLYYESKDIWVSDNALLVRAKNEDTTHFLFYLLRTLNLNSMAEGSSHPLLTQTLLKSIEIQVPPFEKIKEFDFQLEVIQNRIESNQTQIRTLTTLRDTLLPKLMSGDVRVER